MSNNTAGMNKVAGGAAMSNANRVDAASDMFASMGISKSKAEDQICCRCKGLVKCSDTTSPHVNASGRYYHETCFSCKVCDVQLQYSTSFLVNGDYVCSKHNQEKFECNKCKKDISNERVDAFGVAFHPECFVCTAKGCDKPLADAPFRSKMMDPYCMEHFEKLFPDDAATLDKMNSKLPKCSLCTEPMNDFIESDGKKFHLKCFDEWALTQETGSGMVCCICNKPANTWTEANGKIFHPPCFKCKNCDAVITIETAKMRKKKFYCLPCHKDPFRDLTHDHIA